MPNISIRRAHALTSKQALTAAKDITKQLKDDYGIETVWTGGVGRIKGAGVKGEVRLAPEELALDLELGFMLLMFREKISEGIQAKLDEVLSPKARNKRKT